MVKQDELVTFLRSLADSIEQKGIVENSISVNIHRGLKEGPPEDGWKTWEPTGEKHVRISFSYKEAMKCRD